MPDADAVEAAIKACPFVVVSDVLAEHRHDPPRPCPAARRRLGREGRHRHQFRAPHLAPARLSACARRGAAGLVDRRRGGAAAWVWRGRLLMRRRRRSLPSTRRCRPSRMTAARDFDIGAYAGDRCGGHTTRWRRSNGRRRMVRQRAVLPPASSPTATSTRPTARRASSPFAPSRKPARTKTSR